MDYRLFNLSTLVAIFNVWLDPRQSRPLLLGIPGVAPFVPQLEALYEKMGRLQLNESAAARALKEISERATAVDVTHDRLLAGMFDLLTTLIRLSDDSEFVERVQALRDKIFPMGPMGISQSYLSESGYVTMAEMKITDADKALLEAVSYNGRTLRDDYNAWVEAGKTLGALEAEKTQLSERDDDGTRPGDIRDTRFEAVRLISVIVSVLDLPDMADEETKKAILQPFRSAEEKALKKAKRKGAKGEGEGDGEDETVDEAPVDTGVPTTGDGAAVS